MKPSIAFLAITLLAPAIAMPAPAADMAPTTAGMGPAADIAPTTATPAPSVPNVFELSHPPVTAAQQGVLDRIRRQRKAEEDPYGGVDFRGFGDCVYNWGRWSLAANGVRTTTYGCRSPVMNRSIAVSCEKLQMATTNYPVSRRWEPWRTPAAGTEERVVAALCANLLPAAGQASASRN